ncbi:cobyrinate a,c-diamide synthase [Gemmobacter serpentinus]|uniref:cobyrinate a,c-diamide synthase n=1 Tax=Gemmobacter serpentinus TaxID=2652247 RepID=UPI001CF66B95|nr:cobyrinate a,c-diamide synthase [Gemmobacter serpentinus]
MMAPKLMPPGLMIAAPASSSGKTTVMLGLLAAFRAAGLRVQPFKSGPDYIDPAFHAAASRRQSLNLDSWAMTPGHIARLRSVAAGADLVLAEGSMGLFDGVAQPGESGSGASADIAAAAGWPVLAVLDISGQAQTAGALALGLARFREDTRIAGVILNRVASPRHEALARAGLDAAGLPVLGALPRRTDLSLPERHLGLVQATETPELEALLSGLGRFIADHCDLAAIRALGDSSSAPHAPNAPLQPPAARIALAQDAAFSFIYPHLIADWRAGGATILPFSPLADQAPDPSADLVWLPGGYPELHAPRLSGCESFRNGLQSFARTRPVHGECGGYMALGAGLTDAEGTRWPMAGLLGLETSFAKRRMHLGYRLARPHQQIKAFSGATRLRGHEFHYATITAQPDAPLAEVQDATGAAVPETGSLRHMQEGGMVSGTFFHLIAPQSGKGTRA